MRTLSVNMAAALARGSTQFARIWRITKPDGTVIRLTDNVEDVVVGSEVFVARIGFTATAAYISSLPGSAQSTQLVCMTDALGVSRADILSRKLTGCAAKQSVVEWHNPSLTTADELVLMNGTIGRIQVSNRGRATVEILPRTGAAIAICNEQYSVACRNSLGDALCTVPINNLTTTFTVTAVSSRQSFTASTLNNQADGYYGLGHIVWQGGLNDQWTSDVRIALANLSIQLFFPPPLGILVGDVGVIYPGCDLQQQTCKLKFNNLLNFRAEPYRPQWNVVALPPAAAPIPPPASGPGLINPVVPGGGSPPPGIVGPHYPVLPV